MQKITFKNSLTCKEIEHDFSTTDPLVIVSAALLFILSAQERLKLANKQNNIAIIKIF